MFSTKKGVMATMKRLRMVLTALMLAALLVLPFPTASPAQGPNEDCPPGTTLVVKFEWDGSGYYPEGGNAKGVAISGDELGGSWTSIVGIHYWIIKGATDTETYEHNYGPCHPGVYGGDFYASDLVGPQGQEYPDISNIQFCAPVTAITLVSFTAKVGAGGVALAWVGCGAFLLMLGLVAEVVVHHHNRGQRLPALLVREVT